MNDRVNRIVQKLERINVRVCSLSNDDDMNHIERRARIEALTELAKNLEGELIELVGHSETREINKTESQMWGPKKQSTYDDFYGAISKAVDGNVVDFHVGTSTGIVAGDDGGSKIVKKHNVNFRIIEN